MSNLEQTLSIIKPDAVERNLENEIKEMFKKKGFSILKEKKIQIDRTQPLNENSMMVWVNEVNFIDLYNWMILMGDQGGEIEKMNIRKSKQDKVNAQISIVLKTN